MWRLERQWTKLLLHTARFTAFRRKIRLSGALRTLAVCSRFLWTILCFLQLSPCDSWPSQDGLSGYHFASVQAFPWGCGSALQSGRSRARFPIVTGIFHWINPSGRTVALGSTQPLTEMSTTGICWGEWRRVRGAENFTIFTCWLSWHLGASASRSPNGLSRPVMVYLFLSIASGSYSDSTSGLPEVLAAMAGLFECLQKSRTSRVTM